MSHLWKPTFLDLPRQVEEVFEELVYRRWSVAGPVQWRPLLDLHETPDAFIVEVDLPGTNPDEVRILVSEQRVTISGQRWVTPPANAITSRCERASGAFLRTIELPAPVTPERARAESWHGHYTLTLPRKQPGSGVTGAVVQLAVLATDRGGP